MSIGATKKRCAILNVPKWNAAVQEHAFARLGLAIGMAPWAMAIASLAFYAVLASGLALLKGDAKVVFLKMETDFLKTFTLRNEPEYAEYDMATGLFPDVRSISLVETPVNGNSPLSSAVFRSVTAVEATLMETLKASYDDRQYTYTQLCARPVSSLPCQALSGVSLLLARAGTSTAQRLQQLEAMETSNANLLSRARWLIQGIPNVMRGMLPILVVSSATFPGATATDDQLAQWLTKCMAFSSRLDLQDTPAGRKFEKAALKHITEDAKLHLPGAGATMRVTALASGSLGIECVRIGSNAVPLVLVVVVVMCVYVVLMLGAETRAPGESQLLVMLCATMIPLLSTLAAFGIVGFMGERLNVLAVMAPFLGIATGIDGTFLIVTAVKSVDGNVQDDSKLMSDALARAGPAITTTTVTSVASFGIAALTTSHFPGFSVFSTCQALLLALNWFGMLVLLPSLIVLNGRRIAQNRWDLVPCLRRKAPEAVPEAEDKTKQSVIARLDLARRGKAAVASYMAPAIAKNTVCQILGTCVWLALVISSACLLPSLGKGMPDRYFITDTSQVMKYMDDLDKYFPIGYPIELSILLSQPRLDKQSYRSGLQQLMQNISANPLAITGQPDCWPLTVANSISSTASETQAQQAVTSFLTNPAYRAYSWDVRLSPYFSGSFATSLQAARCRIMLWQPTEAKGRSDQAKLLRDLAAQSSISALPYHVTFPIQVARYNSIKKELLISAGFCTLAVFVSLLISLPTHLAILAQINIMAVILFLFGFMVVAKITCNAISYSICVMALGFCVDYSCHVVHFMEHDAPHDLVWNERVLQSLKECGFDVIQGCFTAFFGVAMLYFAGAEAFRMLAFMSMCITFFGGLFALWGLPAMISLASSIAQKVFPVKETSV